MIELAPDDVRRAVIKRMDWVMYPDTWMHAERGIITTADLSSRYGGESDEDALVAGMAEAIPGLQTHYRYTTPFAPAVQAAVGDASTAEEWDAKWEAAIFDGGPIPDGWVRLFDCNATYQPTLHDNHRYRGPDPLPAT